MDNQIPASDLLTLVAQLRAPLGASPGGEVGDFGVYMRGVRQGRAQAAERLEELLREYGIEVSEQPDS